MTSPFGDRGTRAVLIALSAFALSTTALAARAGQRSARTVWDGVYTDAQAGRGKEGYARDCASCHLDSLGGADMAPALTGQAFLTTWNELTVGDLFERVRISMPQDSPASLSRQQYADIVAYMLQANRFPAGAAELGPELAPMKEIVILMKAPSRR
jgi:mono/diheme cytochrome c family protein